MNLQQTYANDRQQLHEIALRYRNCIISGAGEVSYLAARAEKQLEKMEQDLEEGRIDDGGLSRSLRKSAEDPGADAGEEGTDGGEQPAGGHRAQQG